MAQPDGLSGVTEEATRRRFLQLATAILGVLGTVILAVPLVGAIAGPAFRRKARRFAKVAAIDALPTGQPVSVTFASETHDAYLQETGLRTAWAVKLSQNDVAVYSPICPHLGCAYTWDAQRKEFDCPCHRSVFALDGHVLAGPAPRPLDRLPTKIDSGNLLVEWEVFKLGVTEKVPV